MLTNSCDCVDSIISGHYEKCSYSKIETRSPCDFIQIKGQGVLISAKSAIFTEISDRFAQKSTFIENQTILIDRAGQLECHRENFNIIHKLNQNLNLEKKSFGQKIKLLKNEANLTQLIQIKNRNQIMSESIKDLENFRDTEFISVNGNLMSHESVMSALALIVLFVFLIIICFFLTKFYKKFHQKFLELMD